MSTDAARRELPMRSGWKEQRERASRNEAAVLDAARRLFRSGDIGKVDVRQIARAAGVGVGTVYRHFGDKAGLLAAVVGDDERALQDALLSGPPPLGPGAPASERLAAFLRALARLTEQNLGALLATESAAAGARLHVGAYHVWRLHVTTLLREMLPTRSAREVDWRADALLAPLAADLYAHHRRERGMSAKMIAGELVSLGDALSFPERGCGRQRRR